MFRSAVALQQPTFISCQACAFVFAGFAQGPMDGIGRPSRIPPVFAHKFFLLFRFLSRDRSPLLTLFFHRDNETSSRSVDPRVEGERSVQDRGNLKKSFGKDYEDQREREREEKEEEEERISVQLERSVNTRIYASSRAGEKSGSDVIVGSQGRDEGAARHESRS